MQLWIGVCLRYFRHPLPIFTRLLTPSLAVRTLIRHGAALDSVITPARVENSPIRCSVASNVLHIAAVIGNVTMAKVILEAQVRPHDAAGGSAP